GRHEQRSHRSARNCSRAVLRKLISKRRLRTTGRIRLHSEWTEHFLRGAVLGTPTPRVSLVPFHRISDGLMKRLCTAGLFVALLASAPAGAQVTVKLTAPNVPNGGTVAAFGVYMSPYTGTVDGQQV